MKLNPTKSLEATTVGFPPSPLPAALVVLVAPAVIFVFPFPSSDVVCGFSWVGFVPSEPCCCVPFPSVPVPSLPDVVGCVSAPPVVSGFGSDPPVFPCPVSVPPPVGKGLLGLLLPSFVPPVGLELVDGLS